MAFKFVVFCAALAYANAGLIGAPAAVAYSPASAVSHAYISQATAPVAYAAPAAYAAPVATYAHAAPVAYAAPSVGATHQSVVRGLGGAQAVSHYSKAVDSPFSSVRKYDTRVTNDAVYAHAAYAAPAYATQAYAAPAYAAPAYAAHGYAAPAYAAHSYAAPAYASHGYAAPAYAGHGYSAPIVKTAAVAYSPAAVVSHASFSGLGVSYGW